MSQILVIIMALLLTLAPLQWQLPLVNFQDESRQSWNEILLLLLTVQSIFYGVVFVQRKKILSPFFVQLSGVLSGWLIVLYLWQLPLSPNPQEFFRLLLVVWTLPLLHYLVVTLTTRGAVLILMSLLLLHSFWGIGQFILQHDLGLHLIGETQLSPHLPGVAKFQSSAGTNIPPSPPKLIRAYGPYPHANSLAGSLAAAFLVGVVALKRYQHPVLIIGLPLLFLGLLTTFSRAAGASVLSTIVIMSFLFWQDRETKLWDSWLKLCLIYLLTIMVFTPLLVDRMIDVQDQAVGERLAGLQSAHALLREHPWRGLGLGNYTDALHHHFATHNYAYQPWEIVPIHSVPVLLLAEWGLLGVIMLISILVWYLRRIPRYYIWYLLPLLPLLVFDHYFFTQAAPLLWLGLALLLLHRLEYSTLPVRVKQ
ncbi:MAG: O-antigen ligase family protein [Candidatus Andersenbacteria bacterium]